MQAVLQELKNEGYAELAGKIEQVMALGSIDWPTVLKKLLTMELATFMTWLDSLLPPAAPAA